MYSASELFRQAYSTSLGVRVAEIEVLGWVDGDTVDTKLDIGWGIVLVPRTGEKAKGPARLRIVAADGGKFDTPELKDEPARAKAATNAAACLLPPGSRAPIVSYGLDVFGRTLAAVQLPGCRDLASVMTALGHIKHHSGTP